MATERVHVYIDSEVLQWIKTVYPDQSIGRLITRILRIFISLHPNKILESSISETTAGELFTEFYPPLEQKKKKRKSKDD